MDSAKRLSGSCGRTLNLLLQVIRIMDSILLKEGNKTLRTLHLYLCVHAIFTRRYCMSTMSNKLVNGKIEPKGIKELRVYEKAVLKLVSNPHYVQERETSQFYKTILKASNGYRRLDCKLETYPWISFACGIKETNSLSQVSQTGTPLKKGPSFSYEVALKFSEMRFGIRNPEKMGVKTYRKIWG